MPRISILLAEDDQRVMSAIKGMLESEGWIVATAANGKIALQKLEGGDHYDLLLTDNRMPGIIGCELVRRVRTLAHRRYLRVIMISADPIEVEARAAGADLFLQKPQELLKIPEAVEHLVSPPQL